MKSITIPPWVITAKVQLKEMGVKLQHVPHLLQLHFELHIITLVIVKLHVLLKKRMYC